MVGLVSTGVSFATEVKFFVLILNCESSTFCDETDSCDELISFRAVIPNKLVKNEMSLKMRRRKVHYQINIVLNPPKK